MMAVRRLFTQLSLFITTCMFFMMLSSPAMGQVEGGRGLDASGLQKQFETVSETAESAALAGHNAWMLTCCALVLFMTAPGLALFYGGLVRKKNVLGVMMQCFFLMGLMTVLWALYGYTLAFGGSATIEIDGQEVANPAFNPYVGNFDHLFMRGVSRVWDEEAGGPHTPMAGAIPAITFMLFQGMFFIITPALICGAYAERMKFSTMVVFTILWGTLIYCPLAHWVWGGGILAYGGAHSIAGGALDFAGGTVVHISSGISALVCALVLGRRLGWGYEDMRPHNLTYTVMGAAMLWIGWFGFNAGSELASDDLTSSAFATTHFAGAAGAIAWAVMEWIARGKPSVLGTASGAIAGLVCITPGAGFVNLMPALIMGAAAVLFVILRAAHSKPLLNMTIRLTHSAFTVWAAHSVLFSPVSLQHGRPGILPKENH